MAGSPAFHPLSRHGRQFVALGCVLALIAACSSAVPGTSTGPSPSGTPAAATGTPAAASATPAAVPPTSLPLAYTARFVTSGDEVQGWWWLRDDLATNRAMWIFDGIPSTGDVVLDLNMLATDAVNGARGVDASFWLSYGSTAETGAGVAAEVVTLSNVSPADDPVGYTTAGTYVIPRSALPSGTTEIWVKIARSDNAGGNVISTNIGINEYSVMLQGAGGAATPRPSVAPAPPPTAPPAFTTQGDYIQGWWWLRDRAGTNRAVWTFGVPATGDIVLDLNLLATNRVSGGPGFDAQIWLSYGAGRTVGQAAGEQFLTLPNVSPPGDPVGYTTHGTFTIPRSSLPAGTTTIWVKITRSDSAGGSIVTRHIAVNAAGVTVTGGGGATASPSGTAEPTVAPTPTPTPTASATPTGDGPGRGTPTVVSVGDSYIAGEGGRWAGNVNVVGTLSSDAIDALGASAYYDNANQTAESITGCHRSGSAEIHIGANQYGPTVISANLACSGATTETSPQDPNSTAAFKPGLDAYGDIDGVLYTDEPTAFGARISQAVALRQFAKTHNVKMVVVSIGGNNFHFGDTVEQCVKDFLFSASWWKDYCSDDAVAGNFDTNSVTLRQLEIRIALQNVHDAMVGAGYADNMWTMVVQTYPSPLPGGGGIRYAEVGYGRQTTGGCGFWNADADWANNTVLPTVNNTVKAAALGLSYTNVKILDLQQAFVSRRLCENTVGTLNDKDLSSWQSSGAVDKTEWVAPIRGVWNSDNVGGSSPYQKQESFHPNYWGQLALRNCLRQVYNNGAVRGGSCIIDQTGLNDRNEPYMRLITN